MNQAEDDTFFDRAELMEAMAAPEYATSGRYRDQIAAKLHRSVAAGTITPMGEQVAHHERSHTRTAYNTDAGLYGDAVVMPKGDAAWAEAGKVADGGYFKTPEQVAAAFSAPAFEIDPTYQQAVRTKIERSQREGWLTADLQASDPTQRNR